MVILVPHDTELEQAFSLGISVRQDDAEQRGASSLKVHYSVE